MTTRKARGYGSFGDVPQKDALSFAIQPLLAGETMGFRLAYEEGVFQESRGRCWQSRSARPEWQLDHPEETGENLGFRLAREGT